MKYVHHHHSVSVGHSLKLNSYEMITDVIQSSEGQFVCYSLHPVVLRGRGTEGLQSVLDMNYKKRPWLHPCRYGYS